MSRGGRGGGGAGRMGGRDLPFEVDTALENEVHAARDQFNDDDDWTKTLYPAAQIHFAPPPTAQEKRLVNKWREHRSAMRRGPFFFDEPRVGKRDLAEFNAFEDVATYNNKKAKRTGGLPNLKKVPIVKELLPRELWDTVSDDTEGGVENPVKKNLAFLKKRQLDKLAQFDDNADADAAGADAKDSDDEADQEGESGVDEPQDDDFSEDDDDAGDDYNAEKYFDDGDGVDDDGDDGGAGEDAWDGIDYNEQIRPAYSYKMADRRRSVASQSAYGTGYADVTDGVWRQGNA